MKLLVVVGSIVAIVGAAMFHSDPNTGVACATVGFFVAAVGRLFG